MKSKDNTMTEADITVNGVELSFAQSMTLRVALSSFLMCCNDEALGGIGGPLYAARCEEILKIIHSGAAR